MARTPSHNDTNRANSNVAYGDGALDGSRRRVRVHTGGPV